MRVVLIGCRDSSRVALDSIYQTEGVQIVGIVTRRTSRFSGDFTNLASSLSDTDVPVLFAEDVDKNVLEDWVLKKNPKVVFCIGWSTLLSGSFVRAVPLGVVGYHPAPLPRGRGRHPIVWALALGLQETASTLFLMDDGADSGPVLEQSTIKISIKDDAASLYNKILSVLSCQLARLVPRLRDDAVNPQPQSEKNATYWRRRNRADGRIDWRMSAHCIYNLVRALTRPYVGAHYELPDGTEAKIWRVRTVDDISPYHEPGKVITKRSNFFLIKCGEGALWVEEHEMDVVPEEGTYL